MQVMREVWYWSDPSAFGRGPASDDLPARNRNATPPIIGWWWAFFLLSGFANNLSQRIEMSGTSSPDALQISYVLSLIADVLSFPAALLAVRLVGTITRWQRERYSLVQQSTMNAAVSAAPVG